MFNLFITWRFLCSRGNKERSGRWEAAEDLAIELLKECIELQPRSYFPYHLLERHT